jgi:hypothetical protein
VVHKVERAQLVSSSRVEWRCIVKLNGMAHCWLQLFNTSVWRNNSRLENSLGRCKSINLCLLELLDTSEVRVDTGV